MNRLPEAIGELLQKENYTYGDLVEIVRYLRSENGCPWDRAQTHETLSVNLVEECYELVDAIALKSADKMREETGDVLLQAVFHAVLGEEAGEFTNGEMLNEICRKLITRHTHVFGNDGADGAEEALVNWDKNKYREKGHKSPAESVADVPKPFPALLRAQKVQKRAGKFGFDFESKEQVFGEDRGGAGRAESRRLKRRRGGDEGGAGRSSLFGRQSGALSGGERGRSARRIHRKIHRALYPHVRGDRRGREGVFRSVAGRTGRILR